MIFVEISQNFIKSQSTAYGMYVLFYKRVKWFKTFYDKTKPLIESKNSKIYFAVNL